jgi:hypothetical protein
MMPLEKVTKKKISLQEHARLRSLTIPWAGYFNGLLEYEKVIGL